MKTDCFPISPSSDSKSVARKSVLVRVRPGAPFPDNSCTEKRDEGSPVSSPELAVREQPRFGGNRKWERRIGARGPGRRGCPNSRRGRERCAHAASRRQDRIQLSGRKDNPSRGRKVTCRAGNVDITSHACHLSFGGQVISLTGRRA